MSRLEQEVIAIAQPMMEGKRCSLDLDRQQALAFWICKTTLAFESMERHDLRFVGRRLYRELYRTKKPLAGSQIWIGNWAADASVAWHRTHSLLRGDRPDEEAFGGTLAIGDLVAYMVWQGDDKIRLRIGANLDPALAQIWPIQNEVQEWPPPVALDRSTVFDLPAHVIAAATLVEGLG
jgi:hypothetical protein